MNKIINNNYTAVILAGGKSSRFGRDKALLKINGKILLEHIIEQINFFFEEIVVSSNSTDLFNFLPYKIIQDKEKGQGPLFGIHSALLASRNEVNFFTACDVPLINIDFMKILLSYSEKYDGVIPVLNDGRFEPLFAVYNKSCIPVIGKSISDGNRKIDRIFDSLNIKFVKMQELNWYYNINTEDDLNRFLDEFKGKGVK